MVSVDARVEEGRATTFISDVCKSNSLCQELLCTCKSAGLADCNQVSGCNRQRSWPGRPSHLRRNVQRGHELCIRELAIAVRVKRRKDFIARDKLVAVQIE